MDVQARATAIGERVGAALTGSGVEVLGVVIHPAGKRRLVRITVARDLSTLSEADDATHVEPLSLDEIADATRAVGEVLDTSDVMGTAPYTLEVSSPGVDEPLVTPTQFRRNVGRRLGVHLADGTTVEGRLTSADRDGIRLDGAQEAVPFAQITKGRVQVEFSRPDSGKDD